MTAAIVLCSQQNEHQLNVAYKLRKLAPLSTYLRGTLEDTYEKNFSYGAVCSVESDCSRLQPDHRCESRRNGSGFERRDRAECQHRNHTCHDRHQNKYENECGRTVPSE